MHREQFPELLPHDAAGLSNRTTEQRHPLHSAEHAGRLYPELAVLCSARARLQESHRCRIRREPFLEDVALGGHQSSPAASSRRGCEWNVTGETPYSRLRHHLRCASRSVLELSCVAGEV